ncbi:MAG: PQQ-dependent sugar dehydrogenase [Thermoleophilia bacterium]|nr:PQQ-dependent sugar dehydrogenase [Thermoleophilia bacterium]
MIRIPVSTSASRRIRPLPAGIAALMLAIIIAMALHAASANAATAPAFQVRTVGPTFDHPVWIGSPDGSSRIFVVEQRGIIKVIFRGKTTTFLDIRSLVNDDGAEQGLLSMEFDRNYRRNGRYWVLYAMKGGLKTIVVQYRGKDGHTVSGSRRVVMRIPVAPPNAPNHNGGMIDQAADGTLLVSVGDGGEGGDPLNNAQNLGKLMGKILRIAPKANGGYTVPASNPFVHQSGARPEIWALGLRNAWRFAIDSVNQDVWIADVGQDTNEEVNVVDGGAPGKYNFGWRRYEGNDVYSPGTTLTAGTTYVAPIFTYTHASGGCSVTGGYVYRGKALPELKGRFVYADYCGSWIRGTTKSGKTWKRDVGIGGISSFGQGPNRELYFVSVNDGHAYRIIR